MPTRPLLARSMQIPDTIWLPVAVLADTHSDVAKLLRLRRARGTMAIGECMANIIDEYPLRVAQIDFLAVASRYQK